MYVDRWILATVVSAGVICAPATAGSAMVLDLGPDEVTTRYLTRPDGSVYPGARAARYCTAVVPEKGR